VAQGREGQSRLRTAVSVLIATVTVIGALVGWRISVASGATGAADSRGLEAALRSANTATSISTLLATNLSFFSQYQEHLELATLLERDLAVEPDPTRRRTLEDEALRERSLAENARTRVDVDYVEVDPENGTEYFNGNRFWEAQQAETAATQALDPAPAFADADQARTKTRDLTAVAVALSGSLFLLSAATVTPRRGMLILSVVAVPVATAASVAAVVIECLL
jgi:hypothetical protein